MIFKRILLYTVSFSLLNSSVVWANPEGGVVVGGAASIAAQGNTTTITQTTDRAAINWNSFDIKQGETTEFKQPNQNSVALNRVTGSEQRASEIAGNLNANGKVILINPNGILFDKTAKVDVAGLVASTADITNENFMAGKGNFDIKSQNKNAGIINNGTVSLKDKGLAAFVAPSVVNNGIITAKMGKIEIGGAETFTVDLYGDGLLSLAVSDKLLNTLIANRGAILNEGGTITLTATAASKILDEVTGVERGGSPLVINEGIIAASTGGSSEAGGEREGNIKIFAVDSTGKNTAGTVAISGIVSATASKPLVPRASSLNPKKGGTIIVTGEKVFVSGSIKADGEAGGGKVFIGGDYLGGNTAKKYADTPIKTAKKVIVTKEATISANATDAGDGGTAIVWSDDYTNFAGNITAHGGINGGNGGFVETSSKDVLVSTGLALANARAAGYTSGTWLLDPNNIIIQSGGSDTNVSGSPSFVTTNDTAIVTTGSIETALNAGTSVTITTGVAGTNLESGNITVNNAISKSAGGAATLSLVARNDITLNAGISSTSNTLGLTLTADSDNSGTGAITLGAYTVNTNGGTVSFTGKGITLNGTTLNSGAGTLTMTAATGNLSINTGTVTAANTITLQTQAASSTLLVDGATISNTSSASSTAGNINLLAGSSNAATLSLNNASIQAYGANTGCSNTGGSRCSIRLNADTLTMTGTTTLNSRVTGTAGGILIAPTQASTSIGISGGAGTLQIDDTMLARFTVGTTGLVISHDNGASATTVIDSLDYSAYTMPLAVYGGSITVNNGITAGSNTLKLYARTGNLSYTGSGTASTSGTLTLSATSAGGNIGSVGSRFPTSAGTLSIATTSTGST